MPTDPDQSLYRYTYHWLLYNGDEDHPRDWRKVDEVTIDLQILNSCFSMLVFMNSEYM
jgi:hypothetical protein